MKLKSYIYFNKDKLSIDFTEKPINFKGIEIGRIIDSKYYKDTNQIEVTIKIHEDKVKGIRELLRIKK